MRFHRQSPQPLAYASPPIQTWHGVSLPGTPHRRVGLVLDNFEHLLPAMGFVADLLAASPRLKILTTTREALRIGENGATLWARSMCHGCRGNGHHAALPGSIGGAVLPSRD